jgi:hypothetical protein
MTGWQSKPLGRLYGEVVRDYSTFCHQRGSCELGGPVVIQRNVMAMPCYVEAYEKPV